MLAHVAGRPLQARRMIPLLQASADPTTVARHGKDLDVALEGDPGGWTAELLDAVVEVASRRSTPAPVRAGERGLPAHAGPARRLDVARRARRAERGGRYARCVPDLAIRLRGVAVKRFGDITAVDGLDLDVPEGTCVGLLGPNGAGKSTTMRLLTAQAIADEGELEVLGQPASRASRRRRGPCAA